MLPQAQQWTSHPCFLHSHWLHFMWRSFFHSVHLPIAHSPLLPVAKIAKTSLFLLHMSMASQCHPVFPLNIYLKPEIGQGRKSFDPSFNRGLIIPYSVASVLKWNNFSNSIRFLRMRDGPMETCMGPICAFHFGYVCCPCFNPPWVFPTSCPGALMPLPTLV